MVPIPDATREDVLAAMAKFDAELRDTEEWRGWEERANHKYAVEHEGRRYPVKQIVAMASGAATDSFGGGNEANRWLGKRGFEVIELRDSKAIPTWWWVNQGKQFEKELAGGYLWAPQQQENGIVPSHWAVLTTFAPGDRVLHYTDQGLRAISVVAAPATPALSPDPHPGRPPDTPGNLVRVDYHLMQSPIPLRDIPVDWRTADIGPFDKNGGAKQGYAFAFAGDFIVKFATRFADDLPADAYNWTELRVPANREAIAKIRRAVEQMYPNRETRLICLEQLARSIGHAHAVSPASWSTRLSEAQSLRLNVSWAQACVLGRDNLYLVLDQDVLDDQTRRQIEEIEIDGRWRGQLYTSMPFAYGVHLPASRLEELLPLTRAAHDSLVGRSARQVRTRSNYYLKHQPEIIEYLREELDREIPQPQYLYSSVTDKPIWLFQANPQVLNVAAQIRELNPGDQDTWTVTRFRSEMGSGQPVVLWQGGSEAGVYALGILDGPPFERPTADFWPDQAERGSTEWAVRFTYTEIPDQFISKAELVAHPILKDLSVIRSPQGTNFKVTKSQWEALVRLIEERVVAPGPWKEPPFSTIVTAIAAQGMRLDERTLRRYHLALKTRGFVVLSGLSGTGKTWLAEAYANAIGARHAVVAVAPNWTTNEDLLGYHNPLTGQYHHTTFSRFVSEAGDAYLKALEDEVEPQPFHLVLDEMNLARVEYYFAQFLSAMEVRARHGSATMTLGGTEQLLLPPNLFVIGTVNVDETTHGFADKVYDRAQLIELGVRKEDLASHVAGKAYAADILEVWDAVQHVGPFAFRILDEIQTYVSAAVSLDGDWSEGLDEQILQKVLPKLKGADPRVGAALADIVRVCADRFPLSHAKASRMLADFNSHGFASYFG